MNRAERRKVEKFARSQGATKQGAKEVAKMAAMREEHKQLKEGERVTIDVARMKSEVQWKRRNPKFIEFVMSHKDDILTVEYDPQHKDDPTGVCLKEDEGEVKWVFWEGYLKRADEEAE